MRHLNSGRKLNRTSAHRKALFRNLVLSLIQLRPDQDHRRQGQGAAPLGRPDGDAGQARRPRARIGAPSPSWSPTARSRSCSTRSRRASRSVRAAIPGSSSSACAAATPRRSRSSNSPAPPRPRRRARSGARRNLASISTASAAPPPARIPGPESSPRRLHRGPRFGRGGRSTTASASKRFFWARRRGPAIAVLDPSAL